MLLILLMKLKQQHITAQQMDEAEELGKASTAPYTSCEKERNMLDFLWLCVLASFPNKPLVKSSIA